MQLRNIRFSFTYIVKIYIPYIKYGICATQIVPLVPRVLLVLISVDPHGLVQVYFPL